jgi:hypothetical protein
MTVLLSLLVIVVVLCVAHEHNRREQHHHECIHDSIQRLMPVSVEPQLYADAPLDGDNKKRQSTVQAAPIRIHFDYSNVGTGPESCRDGVDKVVVQNVQYMCDPKYV